MAEIIEEKALRNKNYVFRDRAHAGELLAWKLRPYVEPSSMVLAIPSGGVPVGKVIAKELGLPLDLIIVRKLPIPYNTEAGFGSISWDGEVMLNERLVKQLQLSGEEISRAIEEVKHELERRMERFRGKRPFPELKGMTVIIVDDGLASGYTMLAAISSIKKRSSAGIIVETTVFAVADAYQEWHDLTEQEVLELLKK